MEPGETHPRGMTRTQLQDEARRLDLELRVSASKPEAVSVITQEWIRRGWLGLTTSATHVTETPVTETPVDAPVETVVANHEPKPKVVESRIGSGRYGPNKRLPGVRRSRR